MFTTDLTAEQAVERFYGCVIAPPPVLATAPIAEQPAQPRSVKSFIESAEFRTDWTAHQTWVTKDVSMIAPPFEARFVLVVKRFKPFAIGTQKPDQAIVRFWCRVDGSNAAIQIYDETKVGYGSDGWIEWFGPKGSQLDAFAANIESFMRRLLRDYGLAG